MPSTVLLLRAPPEDGSPDKYAAAFAARGLRARSVPVLETVYTDPTQLRALVRAGPGAAHNEEPYTGVIVTSGRACDAWRTTVESLETEGTGDGASDFRERLGDPS